MSQKKWAGFDKQRPISLKGAGIQNSWTLFFIFRGGHTSSTILNSCSFQRFRTLSVKASLFFLTHPLVSGWSRSRRLNLLGGLRMLNSYYQKKIFWCDHQWEISNTTKMAIKWFCFNCNCMKWWSTYHKSGSMIHWVILPILGCIKASSQWLLFLFTAYIRPIHLSLLC